MRGYRDLNPCSCRVPIVLDQNNIVWIKAWSHPISRHFVPDDQRLLLLSFDGKQHSVANFSNAILGIDVDHSWCTVIWCSSKRAVVHHAHSGHFHNSCCNSSYTDEEKKQTGHVQLTGALLMHYSLTSEITILIIAFLQWLKWAVLKLVWKKLFYGKLQVYSKKEKKILRLSELLYRQWIKKWLTAG